jgi:signal transduction histidine kinase
MKQIHHTSIVFLTKNLLYCSMQNTLEGKGLTLALQELMEQWKRQTTIQTSLLVDGEDVLPLLMEEALSNVARHSHATAVRMELVSVLERITLSIADNRQGFAVTTTERKGVGLLSMRERMQALGGNVVSLLIVSRSLVKFRRERCADLPQRSLLIIRRTEL